MVPASKTRNASSQVQNAAPGLPEVHPSPHSTGDERHSNTRHDQPPEEWVEVERTDVSPDASAADQSVSQSISPNGYFGELSHPTWMSSIQNNDTNNEASTRPREIFAASSICRASSMPDHSSFEKGQDWSDILALPQRSTADYLVEVYFEHLGHILPFVDEDSFRAQYEHMWLPSQDHALSCSPANMAWLSLLNIVFAFGCELTSRTEHHRWLSGYRFYKRTKAIVSSQVYSYANIQTVQALLLTSHYLQCREDQNACWIVVGQCIRTSHSLGLHIDPLRWKMSADEQELRRRLWWGIFVVDNLLSFRFGRPTSTTPTDVSLPEETRSNILRSEIGMARLIGRATQELFSDGKASSKSGISSLSPSDLAGLLCTITRLEAESHEWYIALPFHLRQDHEIQDWKLRQQSNLLYGRYMAFRMILFAAAYRIYHNKFAIGNFQSATIAACVQQCLSHARALLNFYGERRTKGERGIWWCEVPCEH